MSMISAQCDELRSMAESVGLAMPQAATLMMEAADTILELRDSVHRERAEADRLRNEVDNLMDFEHLTSVAVAYAGCDECGEYKQTMLRLFAENAKLQERVAELEGLTDGRRYVPQEWYALVQSENAKLWELVRDFARYMPGDCQHCGYAEQCTTRQTNCYKVSVDLHGRAHKLGVKEDA